MNVVLNPANVVGTAASTEPIAPLRALKVATAGQAYGGLLMRCRS